MGNRAKRRAEARRRGRGDTSVETVIEAAVRSTSGPDARPRPPRADLLHELAGRREPAEPALSRALLAAVTTAWRRHWQPADVPRASAHVAGPAHARLTAEAIVREVHSYGSAPLPPGWQAQVDAIDPGAPRLDLTSDDGEWVVPAGGGGSALLERLAVAVETLAFLRSLPTLPKIGPLPGEPTPLRAGGAPAEGGLLHRVASLLAKAESTTFPEEAEALTAKAQEIMTRHAIDRALVDARRGAAGAPGEPSASARRIGIDAPYASAKAILLQTIASANRCRAVWTKNYAFSTVFGDQDDLEAVELLYTSLLIQSARAMIAASPPGRSSAGRTRSFRQSFLVAFASRVGDRLRDAVADTVDRTAATDRADLLPVLADREASADAACRAAFPDTRSARTTAKDVAGWQAGRDAADRAQLDLQDSIDKGGDGKTMGLALQGRGAA